MLSRLGAPALYLAAASAFFGLSASQPAQANLVQNGGFETSSPLNLADFPTSVGGIGQIDQVVDLSFWTKTSVINDGSSGFAFVINDKADDRLAPTSANPYPNQGGGFPSKFTPGANTNIFLWGPGYSPNPQANGFSGPPGSVAGNKFLGVDGDYGASRLTQSVSGFDLSKKYVLSFEYAGAQETGEFGATLQQWKVALGGVSYSPDQWTNPSQGFTPWKTYTSSPFTPSSANMELSFESWGRAASGSGSLPPFLLLDNVQILEETPTPPTPPSAVPGPLPLMGAAIAFSTARRMRRRVKLTS